MTDPHTTAREESHPGDIRGADGTLIGRKDMSDREFLDPLLNPQHGQGLPPAGGWKRHMVEDGEYSPAYQDEYRRLWHEAAADLAAARAREDTLRAALRGNLYLWGIGELDAVDALNAIRDALDVPATEPAKEET